MYAHKHTHTQVYTHICMTHTHKTHHIFVVPINPHTLCASVIRCRMNKCLYWNYRSIHIPTSLPALRSRGSTDTTFYYQTGPLCSLGGSKQSLHTNNETLSYPREIRPPTQLPTPGVMRFQRPEIIPVHDAYRSFGPTGDSSL